MASLQLPISNSWAKLHPLQRAQHVAKEGHLVRAIEPVPGNRQPDRIGVSAPLPDALGKLVKHRDAQLIKTPRLDDPRRLGAPAVGERREDRVGLDRKSTRLNSSH